MLHTNRKTTRVGDCEASHFDGLGVNCTITQVHNNMWLCDECIEKETLAVTSRQVIEYSRKQDSQIEVKQDLFNAATFPFEQLQAAIEHDDSIPSDRKVSVLAAECAARVEKLTAAIFAEKAATLAKENERHALLVNMQNVVAPKLHAAEQEKYKQYRVDYKPHVPKSIKPKVVKTSPVKFNKTALYDAAKKYGLPAHAIEMVSIRKHLSPEDAAKYLSDMSKGITHP